MGSRLHPLFPVIFGSLFEPGTYGVYDWLEVTLPAAAAVEQVEDFSALDAVDNFTPLREFVRSVMDFTDPIGDGHKHFSVVHVFIRKFGQVMNLRRPRFPLRRHVHDGLC